ncbi:MAG: LysR family transcriptional regulator substrate-binding protein [Verrucomicrobiales bacterium]|nr:LysR family transcriptional regulator substrate-binding protein [Verrucomicrobiales bacterium]
MEEFKRELADKHRLRRGIIKVGVLPTIYPYFLPRLLSQFSQRFPTLEITVTEETTTDLLRLIVSCEIDMALVSLPISNTAFESAVLFKEELLLALPSQHHLSIEQKVTIGDLEHERFILMKEGHCLADQVLTFCQENGLHPHVVLRTSQIETVQSLVMAGLGISLVPQMARISGRIPLVYRSLENPKPTRSITVIWRKGREHTPAVTEFLNDIRQTAKAYLETIKPTD